MNRVCFFNEEGTIHSPFDWNQSLKTKLWLYHLHYLDELNSVCNESKEKELGTWIEKWIKDNPPTMGNGWEPYPLSLRLINLIKWYRFKERPLASSILRSMYLQAQALEKQVEYHIRANHLFVNGKALVFIGAFFNDRRGDQWLERGLYLLDQEFKEQFLEDGGHFERSPMYHASLLWDICDLIHLADCTQIDALKQRRSTWQAYLLKGMAWLNAMCHPDGDISFFNDAALDMAPTLSELNKYVACLGIAVNTEAKSEVEHLKQSGYIVVHNNLCKAILDVAPIAPDYQPGHAHADTLSFELSLFGKRFLVNSGTSQYHEGHLRMWQRGTSAHNTVCINDMDSSEVWSSFRVARRAKPKDLTIQQNENELLIRCAHDGYVRLPGRNLHRRSWIFLEKRLIILDEIEGVFDDAKAYFYFHPEIKLTKGKTILSTLTLAMVKSAPLPYMMQKKF